MTALITCLFTIAPALRVAKTDLVSGLAGRVRLFTRSEAARFAPLRRFIIATQVAASVVLLICGGLFFETLRNLRSQELGFDPHGATAFQIALPRSYKPDRVHEFAIGLLERLKSTPGIDGATFGSPSLLSGYESRVLAASANDPAQAFQLESNAMTVSPNFFAVMKIPVVSGRAFDDQDVQGASPVAIISDSAARTLFAGRRAVGQQIRVRTGDTPFGAPMEIVGVVRDVRFKDLRSTPSPVIYRPLAQQRAGFADGFVVKTADSNTAALTEIVSRETRAVDSNAVLDRAESFPQRMSRWSERERVLASIAAVFGILALLLACLGMYGITSMLVTDRQREIAIRLAIGSSLLRVTWLFVRESLLIATVGAAVGIVLTLLIARVLAAYFFNVAPLTSAGVWAAMMLATTVPTITSWLAVRHQARIEPASAVKAT